MNEPWPNKYIGRRYVIAARGPDAFDCWGLLRTVYLNEFGILLPEYPGITVQEALTQVRFIRQAISDDWDEIPTPFDGCGVGMGRGELIHHVGLYCEADSGIVIHAWESAGVIAETIRTLRLRGFITIRFYRHRLWPL